MESEVSEEVGGVRSNNVSGDAINRRLYRSSYPIFITYPELKKVETVKPSIADCAAGMLRNILAELNKQ